MTLHDIVICLCKVDRTSQIKQKVTHLWGISVHLGEQTFPGHGPPHVMQAFTVRTGVTSGDRKPWIYSSYFPCLKHSSSSTVENPCTVLRFSGRLSENEPVLAQCGVNFNCRKTLELWAKTSSRAACGRSPMTECHSSSQHCDVQSASTSRPRPALDTMHNWRKVRIKQARQVIAATSQNTERG